MSTYRGRTGPNVSQYLNGLNTVCPTEYSGVDDGDLNNELSMYTNTDFTNLDIPQLREDGTFNFDLTNEDQIPDQFNYEDLLADSALTSDFGGDVGSVVEPAPQLSTPQYIPTYNTPIQPAPTGNFPTPDQAAHPPLMRDIRAGRPATRPVDHVSAEEKARLAAEEDKRRRNTAASARFRVKKKQREQAVEKTLKEVQDKNAKLEARLTHLEMENKWLKDLITEKNGLSSKEEICAAYERHQKESEERDLKTDLEHTTGVGTEAV